MYLFKKITECFNWFMNLIGFEKVIGATTTRWRRKRPQGSVPELRQIISGKPIDYLINDETTMFLVKRGMQIPAAPASPKFQVKDFRGGGFSWGTQEWQAACVYTDISNTLNWVNNMSTSLAGRSLPPRWAGSSNLIVIPQAGVDLNAFYNRHSMQFFFYHDKALGKTVYTANSADIVTHELGHAILDTYRPDTWSAAYLEVWSFHEAWADLTAILSLMQHDEVLEHMLKETGNDISKDNVASRLAEEVGRSIYNLSPDSGHHPSYLRNAINNFKYVNPGSLPKAAPNDQLAAECHSFGRVFLGAFYDILVAIYNQTVNEGHPPINCLRHARDTLAQYALKAIQNAPINARFYESVAKTMLWADFSTHKKYHDSMRDVFIKRNIITNEVKILSAAPSCENDELIVRVQSHQSIRLSDHIVRTQSQENNELYNVEIEIPSEEAYLYDANKNAIEMLSCLDEETINAAQDFIIYLNDNNLVGDDEKTPFEISDGKLIRTHFQ